MGTSSAMYAGRNIQVVMNVTMSQRYWTVVIPVVKTAATVINAAGVSSLAILVGKLVFASLRLQLRFLYL